MKQKTAKNRARFALIIAVCAAFALMAAFSLIIPQTAFAEDGAGLAAEETFAGGSGTPDTAWYDDAIAEDSGTTEFFIGNADELAGLRTSLPGFRSWSTPETTFRARQSH